MADIPAHRHQYYKDPESGIAYFATRNGPPGMDILRRRQDDSRLLHIAAISFSAVYNPDGPW